MKMGVGNWRFSNRANASEDNFGKGCGSQRIAMPEEEEEEEEEEETHGRIHKIVLFF
jgi:hypothetical protein